ncbi:MAG: hypothetical protein P4L59_07300 [Desulfosporosinus sp.]|nr:hypothetical protein [Desulfosporosinus sp.]
MTTVETTMQKTAGVQSAVPFVQKDAQIEELSGFTMGIVPGEDEKIRILSGNARAHASKGPAENRCSKGIVEGETDTIGGYLQK